MLYPATVTQPTQRAIRGAMPFSAIVDIDGVFNPKTGGFHQVQDALDAGHRSVFVRNGTYEPVSYDADGAFLRIEGEGFDALFDGGTTAHALQFTDAGLHLAHFAVQTTALAGNDYDGIYTSGNAYNFQDFDDIEVVESDRNGIYTYDADHVRVRGCVIEGCDNIGVNTSSNSSVATITGNHISGCKYGAFVDAYRGVLTGNQIDTLNNGYGVYIGTYGDGTVVVGNFLNGQGTGDTGVYIHVNAEDCVAVGNRVKGYATKINDLSGTSTVADNDTT